MKASLCVTLFIGSIMYPAERIFSYGDLIKFNFNLIHTLSVTPTPVDNHPADLPYVVKYKKGEKEIFYLSTMHTSDVRSKTHKVIDQILEQLAPDSVIVEIPGFTEDQRERILNNCKRQSKCVEGPYAYLQATDKKIEAVSGEPSDLDVFSNSLNEGMTEEEFIFYYVFRNVASWRANEPGRAYHPENSDREISQYIGSVKKRVGRSDSQFDLNQFKKIYELKMNKNFDYKSTGYEDIAPYYDGHAIQKMSVTIDKSRERAILKTLENKINEHSKVFIIYGSGHFLKHRPVLKDAFADEQVVNL